MIFNTITFFCFIVLLLGLYWSFRSDRARLPLIFVANFVFYGWWDWRFTGLLLLVMLLSWLGGMWISARLRRSGPAAKWALIICCAAQLTLLGYFKYANFFSDSLRQLLEGIGVAPGWTTLHILLPAGISFYIFQAISYLATVYQGRIPVERSLLKVGVYLGFFPHLVAGPIIRAHLFLPQLETARTFRTEIFLEGCRRFAIGLLYKAVFADNLAGAVNQIFGSLSTQSGASVFGACLGFYGQIYFDFAGYSLMAIGTANWLGYTIPENFRFPYLASSAIDFWHRWHISLSMWLRDYVYIPLGGSRHGEFRRYVNLMATMLLGGLWHGANWNFILWGGLHGGALSLNHAWNSWKERVPLFQRSHGLVLSMAGTVAAWLTLQVFVMLCWVPFRAATFSDSLTIFQRLWEFVCGRGGSSTGFPWALAIVPLAVDTLLVSSREGATTFVIRNPAMATLVITVAMLVAVLFMRSELVPFLYFKF